MIDTDLLKRTMQYRGWTQQKLADALGVSRNTVLHWLRKKDMHVSDAARIAKIIPLSFEEVEEIFFKCRQQKHTRKVISCKEK